MAETDFRGLRIPSQLSGIKAARPWALQENVMDQRPPAGGGEPLPVIHSTRKPLFVNRLAEPPADADSTADLAPVLADCLRHLADHLECASVRQASSAPGDILDEYLARL